MIDTLARLLDLPAVAQLAAADGEIALLMLTHEHADKITIERRRLGPSIDLSDLLRVIGSHGHTQGVPELQPSPIQVTELPAPAALQLAAPVGVSTGPMPTTRRTTRHRNAVQNDVACSRCDRTFANGHALEVHVGRTHKAPAPQPEPAAEAHETPEAPQESIGARAQIAVAPSVEGICDVCRVSVRYHERCAYCGALLGSGHAAGPIHISVNDRDLCETCFSYRGVARTVLGVPG